MSPELSRQLAQLCLAAGDAFPEALEQLRYWLQPIAYPNYLVQLLHKAKFCEQYPSDALVFLDAVVNDDVVRPPRELKPCLDDISKAKPALANDPRFIRKAELCRGL